MIDCMTWVNIDGLDGYQVNESGQVRRLERTDRIGRRVGAMVLAGTVDPKGYRRYFIGGKVRYAHRLVAAAFIGPCPPGHEVLHIDGTRNNHVSNLRYGTRKENMVDKVKHGKHQYAKRTHCGAGHEYTPENTRWFGPTKSWRQCRECERLRFHRSRLRSA